MWPSYQRPLLSSKISRNKKSEKERCTFSGIKDSAHFSSHEKRSYHTFAYTGKHLADYSHKISIISRQSKLIPKELRYQEKIHDTCNYLICQEKYPANSPQNIFFLLKRMQYGKTIICKARSNLTMPIQKTVARPAFSVFPNKYLQNSLQRNRGQNTTGS
jgi:hypothetical protein